MTRIRLLAFIQVALLLVACCALFGRQRPAEQASGSAQHESGAKQEQHQSTPGGQLAEASNEAAAEGDEHAQFKESSSVRLISRLTGLSLHGAYWLSVLFNFALLALLIVLISKSRVPAMFRTRTGDIQRGITEARKASEDANRRLSDVEARLARLDTEVSEMRGVAEQEAAREEQRILQAAEEEKRKIVESANAEISAAAKLAQRELKAFTAELAVSLAEKQIRVDQDTDQALVNSFVEELSNSSSPAKGGR